MLPLALCLYLWLAGARDAREPGLSRAVARGRSMRFVAMLGIHAGITYVNSRSAVAVSLGTLFFLFVGVATCMRIMMSFSGSFELQLTPFLVFMVGGGISMFVALGLRNPSAAIGWASLACPVFTFVAITSFLQAADAGRVSDRGRHLRLHDGRDADPGDLRIRRGHRPHDRRRRMRKGARDRGQAGQWAGPARRYSLGPSPLLRRHASRRRLWISRWDFGLAARARPVTTGGHALARPRPRFGRG